MPGSRAIFRLASWNPMLLTSRALPVQVFLPLAFTTIPLRLIPLITRFKFPAVLPFLGSVGTVPQAFTFVESIVSLIGHNSSSFEGRTTVSYPLLNETRPIWVEYTGSIPRQNEFEA